MTSRSSDPEVKSGKVVSKYPLQYMTVLFPSKEQKFQIKNKNSSALFVVFRSQLKLSGPGQRTHQVGRIMAVIQSRGTVDLAGGRTCFSRFGVGTVSARISHRGCTLRRVQGARVVFSVILERRCVPEGRTSFAAYAAAGGGEYHDPGLTPGDTCCRSYAAL